MPRVGFSSAEQGSSSQFKFEDGNGEIVSAIVIVDHNEAFDTTSCGFKLGIQRLDSNWRPTNDDVVEEFLSCGKVDQAALAAAPESSIPDVILDRIGKQANWDSIEAEAHFEIAKAEERIRKLKETVRFCRVRKKKGDPVPVSPTSS